ncbi:MAG: 2,5-diamino-6-ribosylamino-4(3H)-pyrimidinone 5'-phosphate reductase [Candidatus Methanofastidiosum methylothiophilum]|uniref:2,5-diamino-6-ribosylamino-4(3H)-pyrimidinone 5'-phosphate reductase n=1 Tax=Candidatus Methanofastidiosum methylothiophilum TaxID=1705564 RepID=A0A150IIL2_9EURY|nr:MAG: 2,5-diamino-6-ribosylamino-4(3H)-pyrimidinone 5'-phosphate reductase [Candidatus Methanofastidiosum methylthiophilus]
MDTKGKLYGLMHIYRRFEYCKEVILLLSKNSPEKYIKYLKERNYEYIISDTDPIDFSKVMDMLYSKYKIKKMLTDTGGTLNSILLEKKLIDEISLIIAPTIVGKNSQYLFGSLSQNNLFNVKLRGVEVLDKNYVLIKYDISY